MDETNQMKVKFNDIFKSINYLNYVEDLFSDYDHFRSKKYSLLSLELLRKRFPVSGLWLTHSATGALEMIAKAIRIQAGDEVIMSSFTFVSTANAFVNCGARPVFVDISEEDFNIDIRKIEDKITKNTKAIVVTHYGGHATDLEFLKQLCKKHQLFLIEDAAMAYGNSYQGKQLGSIGDFGVISFDITKQISAVQGGLLICNRLEFQDPLNHIYHIGTNRTQFMQQSKPYYEWVSVGSKYQMNELNAAVLYDNLLNEGEILSRRNTISTLYYDGLQSLKEKGADFISDERLAANIHLFYLLLPTAGERNELITYLNERGIEVLFHYIPLHNSEMGKTFGEQNLPVTESISKRLIRLPLHVNLEKEIVLKIVKEVKSFWNE